MDCVITRCAYVTLNYVISRRHVVLFFQCNYANNFSRRFSHLIPQLWRSKPKGKSPYVSQIRVKCRFIFSRKDCDISEAVALCIIAHVTNFVVQLTSYHWSVSVLELRVEL